MKTRWEEAKVIYSELATARDAAIVTWVLADSPAGRGMGKPHSRRKGRVQVCPDWTRGLGPLEAGWPEAGHLVWLVRGHIWLVFLWLVLSWKQEQELGSRQLVSLGHLGPMGTVTVCFPALLLEIVVWLPVSLIDGGAGFGLIAAGCESVLFSPVVWPLSVCTFSLSIESFPSPTSKDRLCRNSC